MTEIALLLMGLVVGLTWVRPERLPDVTKESLALAGIGLAAVLVG